MQGSIMTQTPIRVYGDTSVFGGVFDEEFSSASKRFFEQVQSGRFDLVTSAIVQSEIEHAPEQVQAFFINTAVGAETVAVTLNALELQLAYLNANIVTKSRLLMRCMWHLQQLPNVP